MKNWLSIPAISFICLVGCGVEYPFNLNIQGLPSRPMEAAISGARVEDGQLLLQLNEKLTPSEVRISPWPHGYLSFLQADSIRSYPRFSPSGPSYFIELLKTGETVVVIGDDTTGALTPVPEWTATIGKQIGSDQKGDRVWVELILEKKGRTKTVKPGRPVTLESQGHEWHFLLLGASIPHPNTDDSRSGVLKEQRPLSIDWLLYR